MVAFTCGTRNGPSAATTVAPAFLLAVQHRLTTFWLPFCPCPPLPTTLDLHGRATGCLSHSGPILPFCTAGGRRRRRRQTGSGTRGATWKGQALRAVATWQAGQPLACITRGRTTNAPLPARHDGILSPRWVHTICNIFNDAAATYPPHWYGATMPAPQNNLLFLF